MRCIVEQTALSVEEWCTRLRFNA